MRMTDELSIMQNQRTPNLDEYEWNSLEFLDIHNTTLRFAVLILNRPIKGNREIILSLWNRAKLRCIVDGGANRWFSFLDGADCIPPEYITGDMDSASPEILMHFKKQGTKIINTPDQDETDFTKALKIVQQELNNRNEKVDGVIAVVETSGRLDHILANMNTLYKAVDILDNKPLFQLANNSLSWLLKPGFHQINVPEQLRQLWCSLVPIGSKACVSTTGLKWNLQKRQMEFGSMVSTSNTYDGSSIVTISTNSNLIWSMGLCKS